MLRILPNNLLRGTVISFCISIAVIPQIENIKASDPVYPFLKKMQVQGVLDNYDDIIIPLSREEINMYLIQIDKKKDLLSYSDLEFLNRLKEKLFIKTEEKINVFDNFPDELLENITIEKQKHLYNYDDSLVTFYIDPLLELKFIRSSQTKSNAFLFNYGGAATGVLDNILGFYIEGTNGIVWGNRLTATNDKRVGQSFTFNDTKINYFDGTQGYLRFRHHLFNVQFGRERLLWGRGYLNKMILSDNPPLFDFLKLNLTYKSLRYDFIHSWLTQPKTTLFIDSLRGESRNKSAKYFAASRLGFTLNEDASLGISQIIIYANRPFEASYLNPFLFWESAQRSLNDLDNSFLSLDGRYRVTDGLEFNSSILVDDINFDKMFKGWSTIYNRIAWHIGSMITSPLVFDDLTIKLEYLQIRPYMFVHPGLGESLTFTNNTYLLGFELPPNSIRFSSEIGWRLSGKSNIAIRYDYSIHGQNIYDSNGNLIRNVGGNIYENNTLYDPEIVYLLDGEKQITNLLSVNFIYEIIYGLYFETQYQFLSNKSNSEKITQNTFWSSLRVNF